MRFGYLLALLSAANGGKLTSPGDWFPSLKGPPPKPPSPEIQAALWRANALARGGVVVEKDGTVKRGK